MEKSRTGEKREKWEKEAAEQHTFIIIFTLNFRFTPIMPPAPTHTLTLAHTPAQIHPRQDPFSFPPPIPALGNLVPRHQITKYNLVRLAPHRLSVCLSVAPVPAPSTFLILDPVSWILDEVIVSDIVLLLILVPIT